MEEATGVHLHTATPTHLTPTLITNQALLPLLSAIDHALASLPDLAAR